MPANKLKHEVRIKDEFVELKFSDGELIFILAIDERGLPYFPERLKGKLPSYVTELAHKTIHHKLWCAEIEGIGLCNCAYPTAEILLWTVRQDGKLACDECFRELSTEKTGWQNPLGKPYGRVWTNDGERLYWVVGTLGRDPLASILCGDCLRSTMEVEFPGCRWN
jgi:hypothetical protein